MAMNNAAQRVVARYQMAAAKYDFYADGQQLLGKLRAIQHKGFEALLKKANAAMRSFGYGLDMQQSYLSVRAGRSDPDRIEGTLRFVPLPTRDTWASQDDMDRALQERLDIYSARNMGDGIFEVHLGG